jgi:hypothetical protein
MADDVKKPAPVPAPAAAKPAAPFAEKVQPNPEPVSAPGEGAEETLPPVRGAQVILDGDALTAARGGAGSSIEENTAVKEGLEASGEVADGTTPDGSTSTGKPPKDVVVEENPDAVAPKPVKKD